MKRVFLFVLTNLAVLVVLGTAARLLALDRFLTAQGGGIDLGQLLIFAAIFGMGGTGAGEPATREPGQHPATDTAQSRMAATRGTTRSRAAARVTHRNSSCSARPSAGFTGSVTWCSAVSAT